MDVNNKIKVLFVCTGNICRSPLAEGIFNHQLDQRTYRNFIETDSAGTNDYHVGQLPDERAVAVAAKEGISLVHVARQFIPKDFERFDYILVMDHLNYEAVISQARDETQQDKVFLFRTFDRLTEDFYDVPDPYYGGVEDFNEVVEIVTRASSGFLDFLCQERKVD